MSIAPYGGSGQGVRRPGTFGTLSACDANDSGGWDLPVGGSKATSRRVVALDACRESR